MNDTPLKFPWAYIEDASAVFYLPEEFRAALTEMLKAVDLREGTFAERTNHLAAAALVAAIHLDQSMADALADKVFQYFDGEDDTRTAFLILLVASTAIAEDEWLDWFREKLYHLAFIAPLGAPITTLSELINDLKAILPIAQWRFGQAEALCKIA
jgi:hypothetical protein